jgi:hypothetical protein
MNGIHGARVERSLTKSHPFVVQSVQEADHKLVLHGGTPSPINRFSAQLTLFRHHLIQAGGRSKVMIGSYSLQ